MLWTHLLGQNPQTGAQVDEFGCSIAALPILLVENARMSRQTAASMDRNNNLFFSALPEHVKQRVVTNNPNLNIKLEQKKLN